MGGNNNEIGEKLSS